MAPARARLLLEADAVVMEPVAQPRPLQHQRLLRHHLST
jgi:hypothetical protein